MYIGVTPGDSIFGNIADWAQFLAAIGVGFAVWRVSNRTNELAEAANRTNTTMLRLESTRDQSEADLRLAEQRLLLVSLAIPIGTAKATAATIVHELSNPQHRAKLVMQRPLIDDLFSIVRLGRLTIPEAVRSRLHYLDAQLGASIVRVESAFNVTETLLTNFPACDQRVRADSLTQMDLAMRVSGQMMDVIEFQCVQACRACGLETQNMTPFAEIAHLAPAPAAPPA